MYNSFILGVKNMWIQFKYRNEWRTWKEEHLSDWAKDNNIITAIAFYHFLEQHPETNFTINSR